MTLVKVKKKNNIELIIKKDVFRGWGVPLPPLRGCHQVIL